MPKQAQTDGGSTVTIYGYNFMAGVSKVQLIINGNPKNCTVTNYYGGTTQMACTLPPGQGSPLFQVSTYGVPMTQLPRWPEDMYFWVWNSGSSSGPNCVYVNNPNEWSTHTWGDNHFCSMDGTASLQMQWKVGGPIAGM